MLWKFWKDCTAVASSARAARPWNRSAMQPRRALGASAGAGGHMAGSHAAAVAPLARNNAAAEQLAAYAVSLRFEDLPAHVVERAKHCLIDAIGCAIFGRRFPWSAMVLAEASATGAGGPCLLPGAPAIRLHPPQAALPPGAPPPPPRPPPQAALALGAFAHAFELDSLRKPSTGVHPGANAALPVLAIGQAVGAG